MFISYLYCLSYSEDIMFQYFLNCFVFKQFAAISKKINIRVNDFLAPPPGERAPLL